MANPREVPARSTPQMTAKVVPGHGFHNRPRAILRAAQKAGEKGNDLNPKIEEMMKFDRYMDSQHGIGWRDKLKVDKKGGPSFGALLRAYQSGNKGNDMRGRDEFGGLSKITHPLKSGYQAGAGLVQSAADAAVTRDRLHRTLDHIMDSARGGDVDFATGPGGVHPIRNSPGYKRSAAGEPPKKRRSKKAKGKKRK